MSHPSAEDRMPPKYSMVRRFAAVWKEGGREANQDNQNASMLAHFVAASCIPPESLQYQ